MAKIESSRGRPFPRITIAEIEGTASSVRHRQNQLQRLHISLLKAKTPIVDALRQDHSYTEWEAGFEYSLALSELRNHYDSIDLASEKAAADSIVEETEITHVSAVGIVYIIPHTARNGFYAAISPLCAAMAAGNCVIVEVSLTSTARTTLRVRIFRRLTNYVQLPQTLSRTTSLLRKLLFDCLSHDTFAISDRRAEEQILNRCCVVSQSDAVTKACLALARTMVTSPPSSPGVLFVDRTAEVKLAARCIVASRFGFGGSSSCAPSAVLVHEAVEEAFCAYLLEFLKSFSSTQVGSKDSQLRNQALLDNKSSQPQKNAAEMEILFSDASVEVVIIRNR